MGESAESRPTDESMRGRARRYTKRATKRFCRGEHRFQVTLDAQGKQRLLQLMRVMGVWNLWWDPDGIPSAAGDLVRAMVTDYWDWYVRCDLEPNRPQDVIGEAIENGELGDEEVASRAMVEMYVGLGRLLRAAGCCGTMMLAGAEAEEAAEGILEGGWSMGRIKQRDEVGEYLGGLQVLLYVIGDRLGIDVTAEALRYGIRADGDMAAFHRGDIPRGVITGGGGEAYLCGEAEDEGGDGEYGGEPSPEWAGHGSEGCDGWAGEEGEAWEA